MPEKLHCGHIAGLGERQNRLAWKLQKSFPGERGKKNRARSHFL
jgi:hypothetical protein